MGEQDDRTTLKKLIDMDEFKNSSFITDKTESLVFDQRTLESIYKIFKDFDIRSLDYPISSGKESLVYKAIGQK
ncbi:serine/threonine protein kinase, partial [mine drainage metagenome]